jgi:hypothetical protein
MPSACPRAVLALATAFAAAGPLGLIGSARAVETWVGANGEIRVVPGTEDHTPPPRYTMDRPVDTPTAYPSPEPRKKAKAATVAKPAHAPAPTGRQAVTTAPAKHPVPPVAKRPSRIEPIDPIRTGAIKKPAATTDQPNGDQQAPPPARAPIPPRPYNPQGDASQPLPPRAPIVDPGNARIIVDPASDTVERTIEPDGDGPYTSADTTLTPDAAAAGLYPTIPPAAPQPRLLQRQAVPTQIPGVRPLNPVPGLTTPGVPVTTGTIAPSVSEQATQTSADGTTALVPALAPRSRAPNSPQPTIAVAPLGTTGTPSATAPTPAPAVAPNPRTGVDDTIVDPQATAYDQVGIQRGPFTWKPAVELSAGGTTNIQTSSTGSASSALRIAPELIGQSNWSRHQLGVELRGSFTEFPQDWALYRPTIAANVNGRIDFTDDSRLTLKAGYGFDKLPSTSALNAAGTTAAGQQSTYTGSAAFTRDMGRFALTLRGEVDRTSYSLNQTQAAATNAGGLDNTAFIGTLRGTYNMSAGVKPFLEIQSDARRYDAASQDATTAAPISHDTTGATARAGLALDLGPILTGESAVGAGYEKPANASLKTISAFTFDENLVWAPTRLTKLTFTTVSAIEPSLIAGASGAVSRTVGVKLSNDLRRNLTIDLGGSYLYRNYTGLYRTETLAELTSGLTWKLSPTLQTFVRGTFDAFKSSAHTDDYTAATVYAGVRIQR